MYQRFRHEVAECVGEQRHGDRDREAGLREEGYGLEFYIVLPDFFTLSI